MEPHSENTSDGRVRRRHVFYIPGYDPFPARRYRELYRKEGAAQAAHTGYGIGIASKTSGGLFGWHVESEIDGASVTTEINVLVWSDLVQRAMQASLLATYAAMLRTAWIYLSTGAFLRMTRLRKGPVIAALYPIVMLSAQALLAGALGVIAAFMVYALTAKAMGGAISVLVSCAIGLVLASGVLVWFKRQDTRFFAHYLMLDYAYAAKLRGAYPAELETRLTAFRTHIAAALESDVDEVLVVGHSSGAYLAVSLLADLLSHQRNLRDTPSLSFLSLGQVIPMVSFLPNAQRLRRDLHALSQSDALTWVDVTAPGDGCAFALCDPVAVTGVAPLKGQRWPLVFSAAFSETLSPARWEELRRRYFRLHFQYLCAFDAPRDYDYFQITAGPLTLGARYANRPPSRSRIVTPVNRFTDMA